MAQASIEVLPGNSAEAWHGQESTAPAIDRALSQKAGEPLPWMTVREAIDGAVRAHTLEFTVDSGQWPCGLSGAQAIKLRLHREEAKPSPPPLPAPPPNPGVRLGEADLMSDEIQNLADVVSDLLPTAAGYGLKFPLRIELGGDSPPPDDVVEKVNQILQQGVSQHIELK